MKPRPIRDNFPIFPPLAIAILGLLLFWTMTTLAFAAVPEDKAVRAIVGEASSQSFDGMVAVGEVIRHRDSVVGMNGYKAITKRTESKEVWAKARKAWKLSENSNLTKGAAFFENVYDFGFPESWNRERFVCVAHIGDHWFFKEAA